MVIKSKTMAIGANKIDITAISLNVFQQGGRIVTDEKSRKVFNIKARLG